MAKIALAASNGQFISEAGEKVLLIITKAHYDSEFGKVEIELKNEKGEIITNNYGLLDKEGEQSEGALKAFSYFTRVAMNDWGVDDVEPEDLVGKFIRADIELEKGTKATFANIKKSYMTEDSFELEVKEKKATPKSATLPSGVKAKTTKATKAAAASTSDDDEDWDD